MDSLNISKTLQNLSEEQCVTCSNNSTIKPSEDPEKLLYILLLVCGFAFFTLVVMYRHISSTQKAHSMDPYHQYIMGTWKEDRLNLVNHRQWSSSLTIENQIVINSHPRPEPGPSSM